MTDSPSASLFDRVVAECGLSKLFARSSMARALQRAGVRAEALTPAELSRALPEIRKAIAPFVEGEVDNVMRRLTRLAER